MRYCGPRKQTGLPDGRQEAAYKAVLRIRHGCGGKDIDALRVRIPQGFAAVKPMTKPGWMIEKIVAPYAAEYGLLGRKVTESVTEIAWNGGSLADDQFDEYVFRGTLDASLDYWEDHLPR